MTRRRSNYGKGYGFLFHGGFANKADAVAKEKTVKGSFVKGILTNRGYRYFVMSPRTNPPKRRRHNPAKDIAKLQAEIASIENAIQSQADVVSHNRNYAAQLRQLGERAKARKADTHARQVERWLRKWERKRAKLIAKAETLTRRNAMAWQTPIPYILHFERHGQSLHWEFDATTAAEANRKAREHLAVTYPDRQYRLLSVKPVAAHNPGDLIVLGANPHEYSRRLNPATDLDTSEISQLWHTALIAGYHTFGDRVRYIQREYEKTHPGRGFAAYKYASREFVGYGHNPGRERNPGDDRWIIAAIAQLYPGRHFGDLLPAEQSQVLMLAARLKRSASAARPNVEFGEFDHGVFHPWTRRPRSRRKQAIRRRNSESAAADLRESFVGSPAEWITVSDQAHMPAGDYAQLGELLALYVKPLSGGQRQHISFRSDRPAVVSSEDGRQLYFVGGNQDLSASLANFGARDRGAGIHEFGEATRIDYKQRKEHVPHPDVDEWRHEFGEETSVRPALLFDANSRVLLLEGGAYEVRREGIVN